MVQLLQHLLLRCFAVTSPWGPAVAHLAAAQVRLGVTLSPLADGRSSHFLAAGDVGGLASCHGQNDARATPSAVRCSKSDAIFAESQHPQGLVSSVAGWLMRPGYHINALPFTKGGWTATCRGTLEFCPSVEQSVLNHFTSRTDGRGQAGRGGQFRRSPADQSHSGSDRRF